MKSIVWFRQDLRLSDNPALLAACQAGKVLPVYIRDNQNIPPEAMGSASKWWLFHSLKALQENLQGNLLITAGNPLEIIPKLVTAENIDAVYWNRCYEPKQITQDKILKEQLKETNIQAKSFNGSLLWEPWTVSKADSTPYKVFTAFYKNACLLQPEPRFPTVKPHSIRFLELKNYEIAVTRLSIEDLHLLPGIPWHETLSENWTPGEDGAKNRLEAFLNNDITQYKEGRDIPSIESTSKLSPHLHFGEISPNQVWHATRHQQRHIFGSEENTQTFLKELAWREFSYYLLFHFPKMAENNFKSKFNDFPWREDHTSFKAWQQGRTGFPIIDAGMRELWQTGYMHNRVRMITASFLVKNCLIDWQQGAAWFWDTLVDADLANNSASWQWVAGSGADAAPYFRIFNPVLQGEKFDPDGHYVRTYCPELRDLPNKLIHKPWQATESQLSDAGIRLGEHYPKPLVDLKQSRKQALDAYKNISPP